MQTTPGTSLSDEAAKPTRPPSRRLLGVCAGVATTSYGLDQATKWWAEHSLTEGQSKPLVGDWLRLTLSHNAGAAFSTGTSYTFVLTLIALVVIWVCVRMARRLGSAWWAVALGLVLGGSLGNVTDRIFRAPSPFRGHVVDFLQLPHWPVFNVADSSISVAAVLFVALSVRGVHLDGSIEGDT
ncbi:MAG: signal peptidase II, partial [Propionibacteriales bacterium]|nr:signal peptidase II [Propionibacteriales bacterium]